MDPKRERKKVSTTVYITLEQTHLLKLLNQKTKVPIAEFIREGIDMVLDRYRDHLPGQMMLIEEEKPPAPPAGKPTIHPQSPQA